MQAPPRQKLLARLLLGAALLLALAWFARTDFSQKISTDVLDLIPAAERSPELALTRSLASEKQVRVALFILEAPAAPDAATRAFITSLSSSPAFAAVLPLADTASRDALGKRLFEDRFRLLLPAWLAAQRTAFTTSGTTLDWPSWLAEKIAADLEAFMATPESLAFEPLLPADPLLLLANAANRFASLTDSSASAASPGLIWAQLADSPLTEAGQTPAFAAIETALAAARAVDPASTLQWTAVNRFAAASRALIEAEVKHLNTLSLVAVLLIAAACVRRIHKSLHLAPVILGSLLAAWMATTLCFDRVHVIVFVVGALLAGVAVDYGFYLYLQPLRSPDETYADKVRRLLKPLLASALTTVLGFSLLFFSELPLLRQLGVFVGAGLLGALATALLWFAQIDHVMLETRAFARARLPAGPRARPLLLGLLALAAVIAVVGSSRITWRDDIRLLQIPSPELTANDTAVRARFGDGTDRTFYLTSGETPAAARDALARFHAWHAKQFPDTEAASLGLLLPSPAEWSALPAHLAGLASLEQPLRAALTRLGFDADAFAPFFAAWPSAFAPLPDYDTTVADFARSLQGPPSLLLSVTPQITWFATLATHAPAPGLEPPPDTSTVSTSQLESLNRLFTRYRADAVNLSLIGLAFVGVSVLVPYGLRRGLRIFALPAGSCFFVFGLFGLIGHPLNLFHLLGAFLGVCLSHNYAIFSADNSARGDTPPPSIRLSALTTAASFAVLATSSIPVVAALGLTVTLIVLTSLLAVELQPLAAIAKPARDATP
jgi:predicted exporter